MTTGFANYARSRPAVTKPARVFVACLLAACSPQPADRSPESDPIIDEPLFVGSEQCRLCHSAELEQWLGSHHELAMQAATPKSVLGDFSGVSFTYFDTTSDFFKADGKFFVRTEDGNNDVRVFEVTHTFGVKPLQQYLVDAHGGRKQALQIAWDNRAREEGGQRWYHLYPDENVGAGDPLHSGDSETALDHLRLAAELAPDTPWFAYVHGVALNSSGDAEAAVQYLARARKRFPDDFDIAWALATMYRDLGDLDSLHPLLDELDADFPDNPRLRALEETL